MNCLKPPTLEVKGAIEDMFDMGVQDPSFVEIAARLLAPHAEQPPDEVPDWCVRCVAGAIPTVRALLQEEGDVIVSVGQFYYLPSPEEEGLIGGAGRAMPDPTDLHLISLCMKAPWVGIVHCQKENPLLNYANGLRIRQVGGWVTGLGRRLQVHDSKELLDAKAKQFLRQGGLKYQLN
jgi:hypothetical protein